MLFKRKKRQASTTLWLVKDDPGHEWYCSCPQGVVDAPWHDEETSPSGGTGWLFTCAKCGKAFMFARARRIKASLDDLAARGTPRVRTYLDGADGWKKKERVLLATPQDWMDLVLPLQASLTEGERYVFLDGHVLPAVHGPVRFQGLWRAHDLADLPHLSFGDDENVLNDAGYWYPE